MQTEIELPPSKLIKHQVKKYGPKIYREGKDIFKIVVEVRHDDCCGNGHNSFGITADIRCNGRDYMGGCCHDEVVKHFPELAPYIKWHLSSTDGPMHYFSNVKYLAGNRDCWGLRKGEFKQHTSKGPHQNGGIEGVPNWVLELPEREAQDIYSATKPAPITLEWKACGRTGEGKDRELDAARRAAIWPDATDEDLTAPGLEDRLKARLPALMAEFKNAVESLGMEY
jgi:hypothetical protein